MRTENQPCSMFAIDAAALGERPLSEAERIMLANDPERRRRFEEHRGKQAAFLRRFPNFESLSAATRGDQQRVGHRRLRLAIVPLAATAVLALLVLLPPYRSYQGQGDDGIKGTLSLPLEMAVVRQGAAHAFVGQAVHEGDKLIFRTRAAVDYLSIFSLEASGRVQAIIIDRTQGDEKMQSLAVHLPPNAPSPQAIEIDNYPGHERIVAVASAAPLPAERIATWLRSSYLAMPPEAREVLPLGPPPFAAQVTTWLLEKENTP